MTPPHDPLVSRPWAVETACLFQLLSVFLTTRDHLFMYLATTWYYVFVYMCVRCVARPATHHIVFQTLIHVLFRLLNCNFMCFPFSQFLTYFHLLFIFGLFALKIHYFTQIAIPYIVIWSQ